MAGAVLGAIHVHSTEGHLVLMGVAGGGHVGAVQAIVLLLQVLASNRLRLQGLPLKKRSSILKRMMAVTRKRTLRLKRRRSYLLLRSQQDHYTLE